MTDWNFSHAFRKEIRQNWNECVPFAATQHCINHAPSIRTKHASIVTQFYAGRFSHHHIDDATEYFSKERVLTILSNRTNHIEAFINLRNKISDFFWRILQVCIERDQDVALRCAEAAEDRIVLTIISIQ